MADDATAARPAGIDEYEAARREKLARLQDLGVDPWGSRFDDRSMIADVRGRSGEIRYVLDESGADVPLPDFQAPGFDMRAWKGQVGKGNFVGPKVRVAGRVQLRRDKGKLHFVDIHDWTGKIQLFIGQTQVGEQNWKIAEQVDLGDLVGADGTLFFTNTGELSVLVEELHFLGKSLETPPAKHEGLKDPDLKQRMRYVDLAYSEDALPRFLDRSKIVRSIRDTLHGRGFVEIEGPTLHAIAGGAAARPFVTHHNALDMQLYLRIALELHLKRVMVGGVERVFELGRVYRNEGLSPRHNPEFTMLEVYQAYGDYRSMMDLTEAIVADALAVVGRSPVVEWGGVTIDLTPPFQRKTYFELFEQHVGVAPHDEGKVADIARQIGFDVDGVHPDVLISNVFEEKVEDALVGPIFVTDYPASICPLTKRKTSDPRVAERFELYVRGMELANAYTELNDPDLQEQLFRTQLAGMSAEESMAKMDYDFVRALRYGMPPAGGLGIGIDRLVMLLTASPSIRDVILFPVLRPEE
ncbi:MAG TPA: lysine--tRNA ligase [Pirellulaceae bacterium]|jgi:lysyl-tRNA synthetase class 2|nr:lysine--tRNA ligase [Pirellulaceae bacterium]